MKVDAAGREMEHGEPIAAAVHIHARPAAARWQRAELVFAVASTLVALHLIDARWGRPLTHSLPARFVDAGAIAAVAVLGTFVFRRSGRAVRAILALLIGTAATIAGLGFTAGHIWKLGLSWERAPGVLSLIAGLALLGLGVRLGMRGLRGWRRLLVVPVSVAAIFYLFVPMTIAVFITHPPPTALGGWRPSDRGLEYRDVVVTTTDGVDLSGWYVPSANSAAVVLVHGSGSTRLNVLDHIEVLARAGYGVLALDARGHGQSEGVAMDLGWLENRTFEAGVSFLSRQPDVEPHRIGVFGISMGAIGAMSAAASDPRIEAVIAEGLSVHSFDDAMTLGWDGWWHLPFYWTVMTGMDLLSPADPPMPVRDAIQRIGERPVLFIAGRGRDERILNRTYTSLASESSELLELPDTKHSQGIWFHHEEWTGRVLSFFDRALLAS
ncbi:MAG: alpha/beta hydrolase [Actinomycetota bacterium]